MLYPQIEQNKRNTWIVLGGFTALLLAIAGLLSVYLTFWAGMIFLAAGIIYMVYIYFYLFDQTLDADHPCGGNQPRERPSTLRNGGGDEPGRWHPYAESLRHSKQNPQRLRDRP